MIIYSSTMYDFSLYIFYARIGISLSSLLTMAWSLSLIFPTSPPTHLDKQELCGVWTLE